jgi:TRAP-type C4-dicarboxylate transport system permease small subunit
MSGRLRKVGHRLAVYMLAVSAIAILATAAAGTLDVLMTLALGRPIPGVFEFAQLALVVIIFMAQPFIVLSGSHIMVELISLKRGSVLERLRSFVVFGFAATFYLVIAVSAYQGFMESVAIREVSDGLVRIPVTPFKFAILLGAVIALLAVPLAAFTARDESSEAVREDM